MFKIFTEFSLCATIEGMKVRVSWWRITWRFLLVYLVILIVAFFSFIGAFFSIDWSTFTWTPLEWGTGQTVFISVFAVLFLTTYIPSITCFYFIIDEYSFTQKRIGKDYIFEYKNIEFIDIDESKRKGMVIFYSSTAKMRYLLGDKDGVLLETLIKKCPSIMSKDEFRRRHPEEKL